MHFNGHEMPSELDRDVKKMLIEQFGDEVATFIGIDDKEDGELSENEETNLETGESGDTKLENENQNVDDDIEIIDAPTKQIDLICIDPE